MGQGFYRLARRAGRISAAGIIVAVCVQSAGEARAEGALRSGLYELSGAPTHLDRHHPRGNWLIVMLWATTCEICRHEFPVYSRYHEANQEAGKRVLGIALDGARNRPAVDAFYAATGARFPTLLADLGRFAADYRKVAGEDILGTPTFMLFDPAGRLVGLNPGPMRPEALDRFIARKASKRRPKN